MEDLRVSLVQAHQIWENKQANFDHYTSLMEEVTDTDLILLPEMFNTGFSMNASELAEDYSNSSSIKWLQELAVAKNSAVFTSLIILENSHFYNRGVFITKEGVISYYDKRKTFRLAGEDKVFTAGNKDIIVNLKGWNIRLQICYDLRFPEISLNQHQNGQAMYDLLLYVANWPERRNMHWRNLLPARAIENQCYLAAVNRVGTDHNELTYSGDSAIIDLHGNRLVDLIHEEKVVTIALSYSELQAQREKLPFLKDRNSY